MNLFTTVRIIMSWHRRKNIIQVELPCIGNYLPNNYFTITTVFYFKADLEGRHVAETFKKSRKNAKST